MSEIQNRSVGSVGRGNLLFWVCGSSITAVKHSGMRCACRTWPAGNKTPSLRGAQRDGWVWTVFEEVPAEARTDPLLFLSAGLGQLRGLRVQCYSRAGTLVLQEWKPLCCPGAVLMPRLSFWLGLRWRWLRRLSGEGLLVTGSRWNWSTWGGSDAVLATSSEPQRIAPQTHPWQSQKGP